jgi:hypothetical protein
MAYMCQTKKAAIAPKVKAILKKFGVKGSLAVRNHSTLVLNIKEGPLDLIYENDQKYGYSQINPYWLERDYQGKELKFLREVKKAMNAGNHGNAGCLALGAHGVGWYINIHVGNWDKPYKKIAA